MRHFNYKAQTIEDTLIVLTIDSDGNKQIFTRFFYRKIVHNADQYPHNQQLTPVMLEPKL